MDIFGLIVDLFTNADHFLVSLATDYGTLIYVAMFLIFFLETGFVIMSFLPGDSLLFVAGTVAASGTASPWIIMLAVALGAIFGNSVGYATGKWLGNKIYDGSVSWINPKKLSTAHDFYVKHGGKTILLARFVPIVRAFAPLIAGAARMNGLRFELFSGAGAVLWAVSIVGAGYLFGNIPFIKNNLWTKAMRFCELTGIDLACRLKPEKRLSYTDYQQCYNLISHECNEWADDRQQAVLRMLGFTFILSDLPLWAMACLVLNNDLEKARLLLLDNPELPQDVDSYAHV